MIFTISFDSMIVCRYMNKTSRFTFIT